MCLYFKSAKGGFHGNYGNMSGSATGSTHEPLGFLTINFDNSTIHLEIVSLEDKVHLLAMDFGICK